MADEVNGGETKSYNQEQLANTIQAMLQASGIQVEVPVIKLIMRYQLNHLESMGAIKLVPKK